MSREMKIIGGITLVTVVLFLGAVFLLSNNDANITGASTVDSTVLNNNAKNRISSEGEKVTIVEFADFQCPACARAFPELKKILNKYAGKVNFIYRHFPLPQHQYAKIATRAAESAGEQGKFWEMSELLYSRQVQWSEMKDPREIFIGYAQELGLNKDQFTHDLDSTKYDASIQTDLADAQKVGVNSTPTIFLNGQKLTQVPTYENLSRIIEAELVK